MNNRDDFSEKDKRILANRVGWCCSFPGCINATVGPGNGSSEDIIILGETAHITAASPKGPRYDLNMSPEVRKSTSNGIWMCRQHARLIDSDNTVYSVQTLKHWKQLAEKEAYERLRKSGANPFNNSTTLIQIGMDIVCEGTWKYADNTIWKFDIIGFIYGDEYRLREYCSDFEKLTHENKFVVIESQGDGRLITSSPKWLHTDNFEITVPVGNRAERINPDKIGTDLAIGRDGDLMIQDGDFATVSGLDTAIQTMSIILSTPFGGRDYYPEFGSLFRKYFVDHNNNIPLLIRLLKLEIGRLATIPAHDDVIIDEDKIPPFNFINRVLSIQLGSAKPINGRIDILISLELVNYKKWDGIIWAFIGEDN